MNEPSVIAVRPGVKISAADRESLKALGIAVIHVAPEDVVAIRSTSVLPHNEMLRCALTVIDNGGGTGYDKSMRAAFAAEVIKSYLALGETKAP